MAWHEKHSEEYAGFLTVEEWVAALRGIDGGSVLHSPHPRVHTSSSLSLSSVELSDTTVYEP